MDTQKLHDLIDKVIGKSGPLRTPAWWMRRVLNDVVNKAESDVAALGKDVASSLTLLDKSKLDKAVYATYDKLCELKESNKLIEGNMYVLTDYEFTASAYKDHAIYFEKSSHVTSAGVYIFLTAISDCEFSVRASMLNLYSSYREEALIDFHFDSCCDTYNWALSPYEAYTLEVTDSDGNKLNLSRYVAYPTEVRYYDESGTLIMIYSNRGLDGINYPCLRKGKTVNISSKTYTVTGITGQYKGLISSAYIPARNVKTAFDPYIKCGDFSFSTPSGELVKASLKTSINPFETNLEIGKRYEDDGVSICRFFLDYGSNFSLHIGDGCDYIYARFRKQPIRIEPGCSNIAFIGGNISSTSSRKLTIKAGSKGVFWKTVLERTNILEPVENIELYADGYTLYRNSYLNLNTSVLQCIIYPLGLTSLTALEPLDRYNKGVILVAKDSNGNIRQWNPADFVDAIEPEEQTTETTEE